MKMEGKQREWRERWEGEGKNKKKGKERELGRDRKKEHGRKRGKNGMRTEVGRVEKRTLLHHFSRC